MGVHNWILFGRVRLVTFSNATVADIAKSKIGNNRVGTLGLDLDQSSIFLDFSGFS